MKNTSPEVLQKRIPHQQFMYSNNIKKNGKTLNRRFIARKKKNENLYFS
jgi:hypothetical protein